jgi:predicted transcriptional regulator
MNEHIYLSEIREILNAKVLSKNDINISKIDINRIYCADLMSDVLSFSSTSSLLITGLTNAQAIRTAEIADFKAIVFIQSKKPDAATIALADGKNIPLLVTDYSMFETCGRLYEKGLKNINDAK